MAAPCLCVLGPLCFGLIFCSLFDIFSLLFGMGSPDKRPMRADDSYRAGFCGGRVIANGPETCCEAGFFVSLSWQLLDSKKGPHS